GRGAGGGRVEILLSRDGDPGRRGQGRVGSDDDLAECGGAGLGGEVRERDVREGEAVHVGGGAFGRGAGEGEGGGEGDRLHRRPGDDRGAGRRAGGAEGVALGRRAGPGGAAGVAPLPGRPGDRGGGLEDGSCQ